MSISTTIELVGVIVAFAAFAWTLTWMQLRTHHVAIKPIAIETTKPPRRRPF